MSQSSLASHTPHARTHTHTHTHRCTQRRDSPKHVHECARAHTHTVLLFREGMACHSALRGHGMLADSADCFAVGVLLPFPPAPLEGARHKTTGKRLGLPKPTKIRRQQCPTQHGICACSCCCVGGVHALPPCLLLLTSCRLIHGFRKVCSAQHEWLLSVDMDTAINLPAVLKLIRPLEPTRHQLLGQKFSLPGLEYVAGFAYVISLSLLRTIVSNGCMDVTVDTVVGRCAREDRALVSDIPGFTHFGIFPYYKCAVALFTVPSVSYMLPPFDRPCGTCLNPQDGTFRPQTGTHQYPIPYHSVLAHERHARHPQSESGNIGDMLAMPIKLSSEMAFHAFSSVIGFHCN